MSKFKILKAAATAYLVVGIILLLCTDQNMVYGFLSIICLIGSISYYDLAEIARQNKLLKDLEDNGTGND